VHRKRDPCPGQRASELGTSQNRVALTRDAHVARQFYRALHELERLQAFRLGRDAQVPLAVDVNI
jgi:hypothetical protein